MLLSENVYLTENLQSWSSVMVVGERYDLGSFLDACRFIRCSDTTGLAYNAELLLQFAETTPLGDTSLQFLRLKTPRN